MKLDSSCYVKKEGEQRSLAVAFSIVRRVTRQTIPSFMPTQEKTVVFSLVFGWAWEHPAECRQLGYKEICSMIAKKAYNAACYAGYKKKRQLNPRTQKFGAYWVKCR